MQGYRQVLGNGGDQETKSHASDHTQRDLKYLSYFSRALGGIAEVWNEEVMWVKEMTPGLRSGLVYNIGLGVVLRVWRDRRALWLLI